MMLAEIEKGVKELSRADKLYLVHFIISELEQEEKSHPSQYFKPGDKHGFWSQFNAFSAAENLQNLLDKTEHGT
jgi:hypothetical protein